MTKRKVGRPSVVDKIPIGAIEALCQFNPTKPQVLAGLEMMGHKISEKTLDRVIKKHTKGNFDELRDKKTEGTRLKLVQKAVDMAIKKDNVTMLIFCLKNMCQWQDRYQNEFGGSDGPITVNLAYDPDGKSKAG